MGSNGLPLSLPSVGLPLAPHCHTGRINLCFLLLSPFLFIPSGTQGSQYLLRAKEGTLQEFPPHPTHSLYCIFVPVIDYPQGEFLPGHRLSNLFN